MSTIKVTNLSGRGGASPNLPDGANVTGVLTATSFVGSGANLTGLANTDFVVSEQLKVLGITTVGVVTGGTYYGDGSNLTGVGETIAPWNYNPDINDTQATVDTGIGVTFNKKVEAGSGTATIKIVNAGVAGTTIQSWGVSSCTFDITNLTFGALVSNLSTKKTYQLDIPEGFVVDSNETSYVGTAWTFSIQDPVNKFFSWGNNESGELGQGKADDPEAGSSPVQITGDDVWKAGFEMHKSSNGTTSNVSAVKTDGTLWSWGYNGQGVLGNNKSNPGTNASVSSPIQIGSDTTWNNVVSNNLATFATKTDGTAWAWGSNGRGQLGQNNETQYSSPVQVGSGTDWDTLNVGYDVVFGIKTDGTMWGWGRGDDGGLGINIGAGSQSYSSPVQIPGTTWKEVCPVHSDAAIALKTNGTLWAWGLNGKGNLGQNNTTGYSSPVQIPGTTWALISSADRGALATKTDGTLWGWGHQYVGYLGLGDILDRSSPTQVPGTTWPTGTISKLRGFNTSAAAIKQDGTLWQWGENEKGQLGQNSNVNYSSPVQMGALSDWGQLMSGMRNIWAIQEDETP
jgi:alpha-tubulin suppressor-like RCC1 family protein